MVVGFYSNSEIGGKNAMRFLGIYYWVCFDCDSDAKVVSTPSPLLNMQATVNGGPITETVTFSTQPMTNCLPIGVSVTPSAPSWLTVTYTEPTLTLHVDSKDVSDAGAYTFFVTADYNSVAATQLV